MLLFCIHLPIIIVIIIMSERLPSDFFPGNRVQLINQEKGNPHLIMIIIIGRPPLARLISAYRDRVAGDKLNHEVKVVIVLNEILLCILPGLIFSRVVLQKCGQSPWPWGEGNSSGWAGEGGGDLATVCCLPAQNQPRTRCEWIGIDVFWFNLATESALEVLHRSVFPLPRQLHLHRPPWKGNKDVHDERWFPCT